eukprot:6176587-Pleurochrysis_carterae.AAC.2
MVYAAVTPTDEKSAGSAGSVLLNDEQIWTTTASWWPERISGGRPRWSLVITVPWPSAPDRGQQYGTSALAWNIACLDMVKHGYRCRHVPSGLTAKRHGSTLASAATFKNYMSCNTTCYEGDICDTQWHRVASFAAPAKAMTNIGTQFKVAACSRPVKDCILKLNHHAYTFRKYPSDIV